MGINIEGAIRYPKLLPNIMIPHINPKFVSFGYEVRTYLARLGQPNPCTNPLKPHIKQKTGSESACPSRRCANDAKKRPKENKYRGENVSERIPPIRREAPYAIENDDAIIPTSILLNEYSFMIAICITPNDFLRIL
jgi:hypothetical protein